MRKKTIGEVLRLARTNQGLTLEELHKKTEIQLDMLEAMEADDFDQLPSPFYTRSFLRKYAWAVELDERIVLDAYDSGSMITYEEVDVDEDELTGRRRSSKKNKKKTSFLPLFYFILFALSIVILAPIAQLGCARACSTVTSFNSSLVRLRKEPPEAVMIRRFISLCTLPCSAWKMAECSLSIGYKDTPYSLIALSISSPPTTSVSLLASAI